MGKNFLLCFHDFSVWNYQTVMPILDSLKMLAGSAFNVLVIPCVEGASEESVDGFRNALAQLRSEGFDLALHGFKHKAEFSQGRSYAGLIGMNLTGGEAEFAGLSEYESSRLLQCGIEAWNKLIPEAEPGTFVPPTWYSNKFLQGQVRAQKMLYEDRCFLTTVTGTHIVSPVVSFAGIPKVAQKAALAFGRTVLGLPAGLPRIALHPVDFPYLEGEIHDLIRVALTKNRTPIFYRDI